jgi:hypothetical protein
VLKARIIHACGNLGLDEIQVLISPVTALPPTIELVSKEASGAARKLPEPSSQGGFHESKGC